MRTDILQQAQAIRASMDAAALEPSQAGTSYAKGAHDAYNIGDKVTHNGKTWVSDVDNNVWEPGVYGWKCINGG